MNVSCVNQYRKPQNIISGQSFSIILHFDIIISIDFLENANVSLSGQSNYTHTTLIIRRHLVPGQKPAFKLPSHV